MPTNHNHANFNQITDHIWIGNNMCCAVHNTELLAHAFQFDIDLELERAEEPPQTTAYLWLPTVDHTPPSPDQLALGAAALRNAEERGLKTYVHCKNGHGRGPTLVAAYLISTGMTTGDALTQIKAKRPVIHPTDSQVAALRVFEASKTNR